MKELDVSHLGELLTGTFGVAAALFLLTLMACAIVMPLCVVMIDHRLRALNHRHAIDVEAAQQRHDALLKELRVQTTQLRAIVDALRGAEVQRR